MRNNICMVGTIVMFGGSLMPVLAQASVTYNKVDQSFSSTPVSVDFQGGTFSFSSTGDIFNPVAIQTSSVAAVSAFGGFLGIPISPSTDFIDRGTVIYGPGQQFVAFSTPTTIPYSNGDNFLGLEVMQGGHDYFGFAYTTDTTLNSYGFETIADQAVTATTAVPEPATWAMMFAGMSILGISLRARRKRSAALV